MKKIIYLYGSIEIPPLIEADEAKLWRVYYEIQGLLSKEYLNRFESKSHGGVRKESTLPPSLNEYAMHIAKMIHNG